MAEIRTEQYVNSEKVKVSFEVSCDDWCLIQQSENWRRIQNFLEVSENKGSQMSLTDRVMLLEKDNCRMEKVDKLIDSLCDYIEKRIKENDIDTARDILEHTKALTGLLEARANDISTTN